MDTDLNRLRASPRDVTRWQKAQENLLLGRHGNALQQYRELARRYPRIPELWFELGNAAVGGLDFPLADRAYQRARELGRNHAALLSLIAQQYQALRRVDEARNCFLQAVEGSPDSIDARIHLAVWLEKEHRVDEAWSQVEACLGIDPRDDQARYFRAFLLHRQGDDAQAEGFLRDLIRSEPKYPYVRYAACHLLGVVLDRLGQYEEAMQWLQEAKSRVRTITDTRLLERAYDEGNRMRRALLEEFTPQTILRWRENSRGLETTPRLAFLGGHPRSGTTLLEQILDAHPSVSAFDEPVAFNQEVTDRLPLTSNQGGQLFQQLDSLPGPTLSGMRSRYLKSLLREGTVKPGTSVLLEKNPSLTMSLGVWLRVFPETKTLIALRDPRDVVISCFFMNVALNSTNVNFLDLERTAKHYGDLMDIWLRLREIGGFDWTESRYEDVVNDLETEGRRVTEFLGLDWSPAQSHFSESSRGKMLYSPTYHDVTCGIFRRGLERWKHYERQLEPLREKLAPYCKAFGYPH